MHVITTLCLVIIYIQQIHATVVFYKTPTASLPSGFGLATNTSVTSLAQSSNSLKEIADNAQLAFLNDSLIAVYGTIQFWGDLQSGILFYHTNNQTWSIFGNTESPLVANSVDGILGTPGNFVVVGSVALADNTNYDLNNVALCNIDNYCTPMGEGLSNYEAVMGMIWEANTFYISYYTKSDTVIVASWDGENWSNLMESSWNFLFDGIPPTTIVYLHNKLYVALAGDPLWTTNVLCNKTEVINGITAWNGTCWSGVDFPSSEVSSVQSLFSANDNLFAIGTSNSATSILRFDNRTWSTIFTDNSTVSFWNPVVTVNETIFLEIGYGFLLGNFIAAINLTSNELTIFEETNCLNQLSFIEYNNTILFECVLNETIALLQLDPASHSVSAVSHTTNVTSIVPNINVMCTVGHKILVWGDFLYAGYELCSQSTAIWNSSQWICVPNLANMSSFATASFSCSSYGSNFVVVYSVQDPPKVTINLAIIDPETGSVIIYTAPEPPFFTSETPTFKLYAKGPSIYIIVSANSVQGSPFLYTFNYNSLNWTISSFPIESGGEIKDMLIVDDVLFIVGNFTIKTKSFTFLNIAMKNLKTGDWMQISPPSPGRIYSIAQGSVSNLEAIIYVSGDFQGDYNAIAGCTNRGEWVDNCLHGIGDVNCKQIVHDQGNFYMVCDGDSSALYVYDGYNLVTVEGSGVSSVQNFLPFNHTGGTSSKTVKHEKWIWYVVAAILATVVLSAFIVTVIIIKKRRNKSNQYTLIPSIQELNQTANLPVMMVKNIRLLEKIGNGQFGEVYKALMDNSTLVAAKVSKSSKDLELEKEIGILCHLNHPSVVHTYGIYKDQVTCMIILEYMAHGNLLKLLHTKRNALSLVDLYKICQHIINGMIHLEERNIVHRDLACRNVLISQDAEGRYIAKLSDFGLSRSLQNEYYRTDEKTMPVKWTAIESIKYGIYTSKSDVWSFGVCLWELFSYGVIPYPGMKNSQVIEKVSNGYRLPSPENCPEEAYKLMLKCWNQEPAERPSFARISQMFSLWDSSSQQQSTIMANVASEDAIDVYNN